MNITVKSASFMAIKRGQVKKFKPSKWLTKYPERTSSHGAAKIA